MRLKITADGVQTQELRALLSALSSVRATGSLVGLDGPEMWTVETPRLRPGQFAQVVGETLTFELLELDEPAEPLRIVAQGPA